MRHRNTRPLLGLAGLLLTTGGCMMAADSEAPAPAQLAEPMEESESMAFGRGAGGAAPAAPSPSKKMKGERQKARVSNVFGPLGGIAKDDAPEADEDDAGDGAEAAPTRSWFPETFIFEPAVLTDDAGHAELDVTVPDRLTAWRVLALAHSRAGGQAGTVATFRSTLPLYIDPVLPPYLYVGDEVVVPVQVVNTTEQAVRAQVRVTVDEDLGTKLSGGGALTVAAGRSTIQPARFRADRPGTMMFRAGLEGADAVEKSVTLLAGGRAVRFEQGGTLGADRKVTFALPDNFEVGATRVRLQVYPGALGVLRSELAGAPGRFGVAEDAYALLLAGRGPKLLETLAAEADPEAFRRMGLLATQRVMRHARSPQATDAAVLAEAALVHPDNPILQRLGARLSQQVAMAQRPDGTFAGGSGWSVRRLMVATAEGVAAVQAGAQDEASKRRAEVSALRASGAFERYAGRVDDAYTAAWAVVSGAAQGSLRERFLKVVREAVVQDADGSRRVAVPAQARRADGLLPSSVECTALAALALAEDAEAKAWLPDLGATLLTAYRPGVGWGDGRTNLQALRAVLKIFSEPLPKQFRLRVSAEDEVWIDWKAEPGYADGPWSTAQVKDGLAGLTQLTLTPEPAVPGMAFSLSIEGHVPWDDDAKTPGLDLQVDVQGTAVVGQPVQVSLRALAPADRPITVRHALPAGVNPDPRSLSALVLSGAITRFDTEDGAVTLQLPAKKAGQPQVASYTVVPTLAGRLHTGASKVEAAGKTTWVAPSVWTVR